MLSQFVGFWPSKVPNTPRICAQNTLLNFSGPDWSDDGRAVCKCDGLNTIRGFEYAYTDIGAPVDIAPEHDNPDLPVDQLNSFDYSTGSDVRCPFAAHTRKMRPRSDDKDKDAHAILRRGIAYGDEVTDEERSTQTTDTENGDRGILFVGYQSDLFRGFRTLQSSKLALLNSKQPS